MEVKPGYKQTEVGVIPEKWEVKQLGELCDFVTSGSRGWAQFYSESGALFIRSQNVRDGRLSFEDVQYVSPPNGAEGNRTKVKPNDLLITITGNSVGNVALVEQSFDEAYISQHVGLVRLKEPTRGAYICRYLSPNSPGNPQIAGSQSGQSKPGLNLQNLKDFRIALPPTSSELQAIAAALSDVDGLLGGLDRLIAKKRDLKQAAMQQLLTGQTRLPGFHGEWDVKRLKQVAEISTGINKPLSEMGSGALYVTVQDLYDKTSIRTERLSRIKVSPSEIETRGLMVGDIVFGKSSVKRDGIGYPSQFLGCDEPVVFSGFTYRARARQGIADATFLFYALREEKTRRWLIDNSQASALTNINQTIADAIPIQVPPSVPEQTAIASVLSEMDGELAVLEQRREKTRALKQAMMQELLTGRTRLV
jgi:type I restriction enzyme S subunit